MNHSKELGIDISQKNILIAKQVSICSIIVNLVLSVLKLLAGLLAHSQAMVSDAIHSASDVLSTFIVMIGLQMSGKESDEEHPYGHERFECIASIILAIVLALTGLGIGKAGIDKIMKGHYDSIVIPGTLALIAAIVSIVVKEWMYWYTRAAAKKINSGALMADAWHHRSDALSSVGALAGIILARMGYPILDSVASILICLCVLKAAYDIFKDACDKMVDKACPQELVQEMRQIILEQKGVLGIDELRTRMFGTRIYVDVEISADGDKTLNETHDIAEKVHDEIENTYENVKHCMVHVNPRR